VYSVFFYWINLETIIYTTNLFGIAFWLSFRFLVSRRNSEYKIDVQDAKSKKYIDVLERHHWDLMKAQCAFTSFLVSVYVYKWDTSRSMLNTFNVIVGSI
jgi:hypothetical protein